MRRARLVVGLRGGVLVGVLAAVTTAAPVAAETYGAPLPRGARHQADGVYVATRGFRETFVATAKALAKAGAPVTQVGPTEIRGVQLVRFLSTDARTGWLAIAVYRHDGRTFVSFVKRPPPGTPAPLDGSPQTP